MFIRKSGNGQSRDRKDCDNWLALQKQQKPERPFGNQATFLLRQEQVAFIEKVSLCHGGPEHWRLLEANRVGLFSGIYLKINKQNV